MSEPLASLAKQGPLTVGILLYPDVEVLDFAGPFEVFAVAGRILPNAPFRVVTVASSHGPLTARHGLTVTPRADFTTCPALDILIVPGGVVDAVMADAATIAWIARTAQAAAVTASVCTGAFLLAQAGMLDGLRVTTHWEDIEQLRRRFAALTVMEDVAFVDEGAVITSAGIAAGIAMSLHLVGRILGADAARRTARQMQYDAPD